MTSRRISRLLFAVLLAWFGTCLTGFAQWETKQINGRDYVNVEGMRKFYGFDSIKRSGREVILENKKVIMKLRPGAQECLMNGVKFVFSYKVEESGGKAWVSRIDLSKLVDPVLRPNYIGNAGDFRTVIIDPGHGGKDPGATNSLGTEANYNLKVAEELKKMLTERGYKVVMTRDSNRYLTLQERVNIANRINDNAIFISIHHNSGGRSSARGLETFTLSPIGVAHYGRGLNSSDYQARTGNSHDSANVALATAVHGSVSRRLGKNSLDRGIKRARFSVLTGVKHPSILIEVGFMTHPYEARLINNPTFRTAVVTGIAEAIGKYRFAVSKKPPVNP
ncbi:N-acetylmuramoyl-L-alanine amidase family protein [Luteolibacter marinus]|uniref:N-acetylmuramoyl-L-alanine amidase family protein n=1 Tax=Luteolibacter marinus TaxID=2776705 RepID=UPI001866305D|nr:N-acetylmuramoyl-L-alanine amidase [Luteolibacter marinus]